MPPAGRATPTSRRVRRHRRDNPGFGRRIDGLAALQMALPSRWDVDRGLPRISVEGPRSGLRRGVERDLGQLGIDRRPNGPAPCLGGVGGDDGDPVVVCGDGVDPCRTLGVPQGDTLPVSRVDDNARERLKTGVQLHRLAIEELGLLELRRPLMVHSVPIPCLGIAPFLLHGLLQPWIRRLVTLLTHQGDPLPQG